MSDFYLYLSSRDSQDIRKNNDPADFYIQFPKSYTFDGNWICAVTETSLTCDFTPRSKRLYLCCNLIQQTYVRNTQVPVLRNVEVGSRYKKLQFVEYSHPVYVPVTVNHFNSLHLYLRDEDLNSVEFKSNDLHCVLHFKKVWAP
jgi:hypothetical protein